MKLALIPILLLILYNITSCQKRSVVYNSTQLQGVWMVDFDSYISPYSKSTNYYPIGYGVGFEFLGDSVCDFHYGFTKKVNSLNEDCNVVYFGHITKYRLDQENLLIWNLKDQCWNKYRITALEGDTLKLYDPQLPVWLFSTDSVITFIRKTETKQIDFDAVLVSQGNYSEFSNCPVRFVYLHKNANMLSWDRVFNWEKNEFETLNFSSLSISSSGQDSLFNNFRFLDFNHISSSYQSGGTGSKVINTVLFLKEDKVIKTVFDIESASPDELKWGYVPLILSSYYLPHKSLDKKSFKSQYLEMSDLSIKLFEDL